MKNSNKRRSSTKRKSGDKRSSYSSSEVRDIVQPVSPLNQAQAEYMHAIEDHIITFGTGCAGTGKSYLATAMAADLLFNKKIRKIVCTRPAVESGKGLGFLPGDKDEKFAPYIRPIENIFIERYGKGWYESQVKNKNIEYVPLEFMMGRTFDDCVIIADEMQNSTPGEMFILLSRLGCNTTAVVNGDYAMQQVTKGVSGLQDALDRLYNLPDVAICEFMEEDIVRSGITRDIVIAYQD